MQNVNQYETITEALNALNEKGYTKSFVVKDEELYCVETEEKIMQEKVRIVEYHRFEGSSNPDDMSVLYVLDCGDELQGTIIDAYGTYADEALSAYLEKIKIEARPLAGVE